MKMLLISIVFIFLFVGCATKVEYKEVYIPTKCDIMYPVLNSKTNNIIENQKNLIFYIKEMQGALNCCINGKCGGPY